MQPFPVLVLSAKHGIITWSTRLTSYDLEMTVGIAELLRPQVRERLEPIRPRPTNVYVEMGRTYLCALPDLKRLWPNAKVSYGRGRIGERMRDLRNWLEMITAHREAR